MSAKCSINIHNIKEHEGLLSNKEMSCINKQTKWKMLIRPHQFNSLDCGDAEPRPGVAENSLLSHFILFQSQNNAPICLQIPSIVKVTLGKIMF
jgi:hypothetical protein